jgi:hypothetical protein
MPHGARSPVATTPATRATTTGAGAAVVAEIEDADDEVGLSDADREPVGEPPPSLALQPPTSAAARTVTATAAEGRMPPSLPNGRADGHR